MSDEDDGIGAELIKAMEDAVAFARGDEDVRAASRVSKRLIMPPIDVRALREESGLTREEFARRFGFPERTVEGWEQGRRQPDQASLLLLHVIRRNPDSVATVVQELQASGPVAG